MKHYHARIANVGTIDFNCAYRGESYFKIVTKDGYDLPHLSINPGERWELTNTAIEALPRGHVARRLYAAYRAQSRQDYKQYRRRNNMTAKEWYRLLKN